ncbi:polymeric immunoglobulin receptor-like isoform X3 [Salarias fasciatus]|uniref:polymeric immunoglobulin receptor-like isoform X3 n=1 Tax=Salarias fasciatus TaxID=181472 RepID=UPI001176B5D6|nr:polymeric immunoglobulin receptor-like isoform X3 [Salarias fasciatus]
MFVMFGFLLMIAVGCCATDQNFEIKSVAPQQNVTFTCPRTFDYQEKVYWIRIISGHQPEFLGGTIGYDSSEVNQTPHFTTKQELGNFILNIHQTQINDTGLYYCILTTILTDMIFLRGVFLTVQGAQSSISGIFQAPPSAAVHPGESVSLQCSVLSDSEKKTCSEDYRVHWFRAGSNQSHPSFIYTHGGNAECGNSSQKCFYNFSEKVSVSDAGTYYCAVAACGEVMFGNGAKLDMRESKEEDLKRANTALCSLGAAFIATIIVLVCLIWTNEKKDCNDVKTVVMYISMSQTKRKTRQQ